MMHSLVTLFFILALPLSDSRSYRILVDGKQVGWERFETTSLFFKSESEVSRQGAFEKMRTYTELNGNHPVRYEVESNSPPRSQKYVISFEPRAARVRIEVGGKSTERMISLSDNVILLDRNVWHHYRSLFAFYDSLRGGKQRFQVFIPQAALREYSVEVERKGKTDISVAGVKKRADRFVVFLADGFEVSAVVDESNIPLLIEVPSQDMKVILE